MKDEQRQKRKAGIGRSAGFCLPSSFILHPSAFSRAVLLAHLALSPLLFTRCTLDPFEFPKTALLQLTALVLAALGLSTAVRQLAEEPRLGLFRSVWDRAAGVCLQPVPLGVLLFLLSAAISTVFSISPRSSFQGMPESHAGLCTLLAYTVLFFATRTLCRDAADARRLLAGAVLAAGAAATYALIQWAHLDPIRWDRLSTFGRYVRPFGPLGHPNHLAAFLAMTFPVTLFFALQAIQQRRWLPSATFMLTAALSWLGVVLSISRGGWGALACTLAVLLAGWRWRSTRGLAALASALPLASAALLVFLYLWGDGVFFASLGERVRRVADPLGRPFTWQVGLALFWDHPVLGCGLDTFQLAFGFHRPLDYWEIEWGLTPTRAHNELIHTLATQGLCGAAALVLLLVGLLRAGYRAWHLRPADRPLLLALVAGLLAFVAQDVFNFTVAGCGTLFVTFAALLSRLGEAGRAADERSAACPSAGPGTFAVVLLGTSLAGGLIFLGNFLVQSEIDAPGCLGASAAVLGILCLTAWCLLRGAPTEASPEPTQPAHGGRPARGGGRIALQVAVWCGALVLIWTGVARPFLANWACCTGCRLLADDPGKALEYLARAVALDPARDLYLTMFADGVVTAAGTVPEAGERQRLLEEARSALERANHLVPVNAYTLANLGKVLGALAREHRAAPDEVFAAFDGALALDPSNAIFYFHAADQALVLGEQARAQAYAARGSALYPRFGPTRAQLGYLALAQHRYSEAHDLLQTALQGEWRDEPVQHAAAWANLAGACWSLSRYEEALAAGRNALVLTPNHPAVLLLCAQCLERLGRRAEAVAEYQAVLARSPSHAQARQALARLAPPQRAPGPRSQSGAEGGRR